MFDQLVKEVGNRFNLGDKALPLVQVLVSTMTNPETQGLTGFIERFRSKGLGSLVESWIADSAPLTINHAQIENVLGGNNGFLETVCHKLGLDKGSALLGLSYLLPQLIRKLAPEGKIDNHFSAAAALFAQQGINHAVATTTSAVNLTPAPMPEQHGNTLAWIVKEAKDRFNLSDKALPLVQTVLAAMTNTGTGGLSGFVQRFKNQGLDRLVDSWLKTSAPLSINHKEIETVFGSKGDLLDTISAKINLDKGTSLMSLAFLLPKLLHKVMPNGQIPAIQPVEINAFAEKGYALIGSVSETQPQAAPPVASLHATEKSASTQDATSSSTPIKEAAAVVGVGAAVAASISHSVEAPITKAPAQPEPASSSPAQVDPVVTRTNQAPVTSVQLNKQPEAASVNTIPNHAEEEKSSPWKYLLWLLPIAIALWLLKSCGQSPDATNTTSNSAEMPTGNSAPLTTDKSLSATSDSGTQSSQSIPGTAANQKSELAVPEPADQKVSSSPENNSAQSANHNVLGTQNPATSSNSDNASATSSESSNTTAAINDLPNAKLYFKVAKTNLPTDTSTKLQPIVDFLKTNPSAKVTISGFHDPTGNVAQNEQLAKNRAKQVVAKLQVLGINKDNIILNKPQSTTGTGNNAEARRVEVTTSR